MSSVQPSGASERSWRRETVRLATVREFQTMWTEEEAAIEQQRGGALGLGTLGAGHQMANQRLPGRRRCPGRAPAGRPGTAVLSGPKSSPKVPVQRR